MSRLCARASLRVMKSSERRGCTNFTCKLDALLHCLLLEVSPPGNAPAEQRAAALAAYSARVISCTSDQGSLAPARSQCSKDLRSGKEWKY